MSVKIFSNPGPMWWTLMSHVVLKKWVSSSVSLNVSRLCQKKEIPGKQHANVKLKGMYCKVSFVMHSCALSV